MLSKLIGKLQNICHRNCSHKLKSQITQRDRICQCNKILSFFRYYMEKNEEGQLQTRVEKVSEVFSGETAKTSVSFTFLHLIHILKVTCSIPEKNDKHSRQMLKTVLVLLSCTYYINLQGYYYFCKIII